MIWFAEYMQDSLNPTGLLLPIGDLKFADLSLVPNECIIFRFAISDPADKGGDKYSNPFIHVAEIDGRLACFVKDVIHSTAGIEANAERIPLKIVEHGIESFFIESNGVGLAAALLIKKALPANVGYAPFHSSIQKETRIISHYEFVKKFFVFDINYKSNPEYHNYINDLTGYVKAGDNKHKIDAIDSACLAANIVKLKYHKIIYGQ